MEEGDIDDFSERTILWSRERYRPLWLLSPGEKVELNDILLIHTDEGKTITGDEVKKTVAKATIVEQYKDKKVIIFKKKRRETYRKRFGHRQKHTMVKIDEINYKGGEE